MKKTKCPLKYIDRSLLFSPYYTLCFSEEKFDKEMKRLGVENPPPFIFPDSSASTHTFFKDGQFPTCIVCMYYDPKHKNISIVGLLTHEASHIFDEALEYMREKEPGSEVKAYALQNITQNLYAMYKEHAKKMKRKKK